MSDSGQYRRTVIRWKDFTGIRSNDVPLCLCLCRERLDHCSISFHFHPRKVLGTDVANLSKIVSRADKSVNI
jgi:hypothetical protein